jgi:AcrR family transcriptional regulator
MAQVGRPRRYPADVERQLIMDAAVEIMAANGYLDAAVGDVLANAGVSTRAFYRHFATKDDLVLALFRRDAEAVSRMLGTAVEAADNSVRALETWIDGYLDLFYDPRRARRTTLFRAPAVRRAEGYEAELARTQELLATPLVGVLRHGAAAGVLRSGEPEQDARTLVAIASAATGGGGRRFSARRDARAHIVRFWWPALGIASQP